jgi:hypothetical protein
LVVSFNGHAGAGEGSRRLTGVARHQLREEAGQNRNRFDPQIAAPQDSQLAGLATRGFWQWGQRFTARRLPRLA